MPQFKFARSHKKPARDKDQFEARELVDEAEAREAVMTFILGLVAEPVPLKSINSRRATAWPRSRAGRSSTSTTAPAAISFAPASSISR